MTAPNNACKRVDGPLFDVMRKSGIEGDAPTLAWHLLADVMEWCHHNNIDFDKMLDEAREHFNSQEW